MDSLANDTRRDRWRVGELHGYPLEDLRVLVIEDAGAFHVSRGIRVASVVGPPARVGSTVVGKTTLATPTRMSIRSTYVLYVRSRIAILLLSQSSTPNVAERNRRRQLFSPEPPVAG